MTGEELRELLRVHGFDSLHEFLDVRDKVNKTSAEIKLKMLHEELENEEKKEPKHSCADCAMTSTYHGMLYCDAGNSGGDFVTSDMICTQWELKKEVNE